MANAFQKAEQYVNQGLGMLQNELILGRLVRRYGRADFQGAKNDTVNVRIPAVLTAREYEWRTRTSPIEYDDLEEFSVPVTLDTHPYSAVRITDEELTLDIDSWGMQVAMPQVRAVAESIEGSVATAMAGATTRYTVDWVADDPADPDADTRAFYRVLTRARRLLNKENVPADGRVVVLGSAAEEAALNSPHLVEVDKAGFSGTLREAVIGRIAGFTIIGNVNTVAEDFAIAFHPTAFALANVAPEVPRGATAGATAEYEGYAMRWIQDYDPDYLRDRSVYSAFVGTASTEDGRDMDPESGTYGELTDENVRAVGINFTSDYDQVS